MSIAERCSIKTAERILGLKRRHIQQMAARGELPGAAKFGRVWTFDVEKLRAKVRNQEDKSWLRSVERHRPAATGGEILSGAALSSRVRMSDGPLKQTIQKLQRNAADRARPAP
jgi:hypothetical protein